MTTAIVRFSIHRTSVAVAAIVGVKSLVVAIVAMVTLLLEGGVGNVGVALPALVVPLGWLLLSIPWSYVVAAIACALYNELSARGLGAIAFTMQQIPE
jgi:hypothetical protein